MNEWKRFVVEMGLGIDQHGQNPTTAAIKAIKDAISRCCLTGITELGIEKIRIEALIGVPFHERADVKEIENSLPLECDKKIELVDGGLKGKGVRMETFGDKTDEIIAAVAFITVCVK